MFALAICCRYSTPLTRRRTSHGQGGRITADIIESIERTPELFPVKTKGILVASANCRELERRRYHMTFDNPAIEGILDGGHNTLAIGTHILAVAHGDVKAVKKIKTWVDFKSNWIGG